MSLELPQAVTDAAVASLQAERAESNAHGYDLTDYGTVYAVFGGVDSFTGLVALAQAMLDQNYPPDIFKGSSIDSGVKFVAKLREALSCVHADPGTRVNAS